MMATIRSLTCRSSGPLRGAACFLNVPMLALILTGCGSESAAPEADAADAALMEELLADAPNPGQNRTVSATQVSDSRAGQPSGGPSPQSAPVTASAKGERLELRLRQGDRFPLMKTVEQVLTQKSDQFPAAARTKLELTMAITVEQVRDDAILFRVRYSRIVYSHDLNGDRLLFDSAHHQSAVPADVQPYVGMVNNGFGFWVGRDNRIRELVGYQEFLQRCVEHVAIDRRQTLLAEISDRFGDDGVANFIDDSIGLLPYDGSVDPDSATRVNPGDVWTREVRMMQPAPVYMTSTYRLVALNAKTAEIDITGRIASGETVSDAQSAVLKIIGGHSIGKCVVDRETGLPLEMNQTRLLSMVITLPDGIRIPQEKQITTTVRAFPEMRGPTVQMTPHVSTDGPAQSSTIQAAAFDTSRQTVAPIPTQSVDAGQVRAVYPD